MTDVETTDRAKRCWDSQSSSETDQYEDDDGGLVSASITSAFLTQLNRLRGNEITPEDVRSGCKAGAFKEQDYGELNGHTSVQTVVEDVGVTIADMDQVPSSDDGDCDLDRGATSRYLDQTRAKASSLNELMRSIPNPLSGNVTVPKNESISLTKDDAIKERLRMLGEVAGGSVDSWATSYFSTTADEKISAKDKFLRDYVLMESWLPKGKRSVMGTPDLVWQKSYPMVGLDGETEEMALVKDDISDDTHVIKAEALEFEHDHRYQLQDMAEFDKRNYIQRGGNLGPGATSVRTTKIGKKKRKRIAAKSKQDDSRKQHAEESERRGQELIAQAQQVIASYLTKISTASNSKLAGKKLKRMLKRAGQRAKSERPQDAEGGAGFASDEGDTYSVFRYDSGHVQQLIGRRPRAMPRDAYDAQVDIIVDHYIRKQVGDGGDYEYDKTSCYDTGSTQELLEAKKQSDMPKSRLSVRRLLAPYDARVSRSR